MSSSKLIDDLMNAEVYLNITVPISNFLLHIVITVFVMTQIKIICLIKISVVKKLKILAKLEDLINGFLYKYNLSMKLTLFLLLYLHHHNVGVFHIQNNLVHPFIVVDTECNKNKTCKSFKVNNESMLRKLYKKP